MAGGRVDVVDGLRGLAIAAVVFHHLFARGLGELGFVGGWLLGNGWLGVDLFFVLSGFVLHLPYAQGRPLDARAFHARRVRRLAPLFLVVALVSTVVIVVFCGAPVDRHLAFQTAALVSGLFSFHPSTFMPQANWVLWSLGVEFVFSALFPLLAFDRARLPQITAAAAVLCLLVRAFGYTLGARQYLDWISAGPAGRLDEFLFGMLVAQLHAQGRLPRSPRLAAAGGVALLLCAGLLFHLWVGGLFPRFVAAAFLSLAASGFALILAAALASRGRLRRVLAWRPLRAVGMACYSIYAWHGILLLGLFGTRDLDRIPVWSPMLLPYLVMLALLSWASFRWLENRSATAVRPRGAAQ